GLILLNGGCTTMPQGPRVQPGQISLAESVSQNIRVEEKFALATAKIHWEADKGSVLPLLYEPAVFTKGKYPTAELVLEQSPPGARRARQLVAQRSGSFDVELEYQLQVARNGNDIGFALPTQRGLVNRVQLTLANVDVDVLSAQAVSVQRTNEGSNTV